MGQSDYPNTTITHTLERKSFTQAISVTKTAVDKVKEAMNTINERLNEGGCDIIASATQLPLLRNMEGHTTEIMPI